MTTNALQNWSRLIVGTALAILIANLIIVAIEDDGGSGVERSWFVRPSSEPLTVDIYGDTAFCIGATPRSRVFYKLEVFPLELGQDQSWSGNTLVDPVGECTIELGDAPSKMLADVRGATIVLTVRDGATDAVSTQAVDW